MTFGSPSVDPGVPLLGRWWLDPEAIRRGADDISICFFGDGRLTYTIHLADRHQILQLTYTIEGEMIITDQPSAPRKERTRFAIDARGQLHLFQGGAEAIFVRAAK